MFNKGEGGFKDGDLYVSCANAVDGVVTAHPTGKGAQLRDIKDERGFAFGEEIMRTATEGKVSKITYLWLRPGSDNQPRKHPSSRRSKIRSAASATINEMGSEAATLP
jgi:Single Cache domain 2